MKSPEIAWTPAHSAAASKEGWDIFDVDGAGYFEIQKIDDAKRFKTDAAAVRFVGRRAAATSSRNGSRYLIARAIHRWYVKNRKRPQVGKPFHADSRKADRGTRAEIDLSALAQVAIVSDEDAQHGYEGDSVTGECKHCDRPAHDRIHNK